MAVEDLVVELESLFLTVLVDESGLQLAFVAGGKALHFYLSGEVHTATGHALVDGFLGAPVDGQLLVGVVVREVVLLVLGAKSTPLRDMRL